jgi:hypothetical protein
LGLSFGYGYEFKIGSRLWVQGLSLGFGFGFGSRLWVLASGVLGQDLSLRLGRWFDFGILTLTLIPNSTLILNLTLTTARTTTHQINDKDKDENITIILQMYVEMIL